ISIHVAGSGTANNPLFKLDALAVLDNAPVSVICLITPSSVTGLKLKVIVAPKFAVVIDASRPRFAPIPLEQTSGRLRSVKDPLKHKASAAVIRAVPVTCAPVSD